MKNGLAEDSMKVYTVNDIQRIFQCSRTKAYEIMKLRTFPSFRIGKRLYTTREGVEKFIRQQIKLGR